MAQISRSTKVSGGTTLAANTLARAVDIETDMLALFNAHNNHDSATSAWTALKAEGSSTVPLSVNNSTGTQNIAEFKDNGTNVVVLADGGTLTFSPGGTTKVVANSSGLTLSNSATIAMGSAKITGLASASASGDAVMWGQAFTAGQITFSPTTTGIKGTTTNDSAAAGNVGEYVESIVSGSPVTFPTTTQWGDVTSISLTAGDWDVSGSTLFDNAGTATITTARIGISSTSGNNSTGLTAGNNHMVTQSGTGVGSIGSIYVPVFRVSLTATTTMYLKHYYAFTGSAGNTSGTICARRVR